MTPDEVDDQLYAERLDAIEARVAAVLPGSVVRFSACIFDGAGLPLDNLDEVAFYGPGQLVQRHQASWGKGHDYCSAVVEDPTWWTVLRLANEMVATTGDLQHIFLEGLQRLPGAVRGVPRYRFVMGS